MRIRRKLALVATTAALATGLAATPAAADKSATTTRAGEVSAAAWTLTRSLGGPIRECYKAACDVVWQTSPGEAMYWSHYAYNEHGNRWYYVRYTIGNGTPHTFYGWIYCGNVTSSC